MDRSGVSTLDTAKWREGSTTNTAILSDSDQALHELQEAGTTVDQVDQVLQKIPFVSTTEMHANREDD